MDDTDPITFWGYPDFSIGLRWANSPVRVEIKLALGRRRGFVWGKPWPGPGVAVDADRALNFLAVNWARIARDFTNPDIRLAEPDVAVDLAAGFGRRDLPKVVVETCGREIIISAPGVRHAFGSESILAAEILMGFADALAARLRGEPTPSGEAAVTAWGRARAHTDILPWEPDIGPSAGPDPDPRQALAAEMRRAAFYCRRLGVDLDRYVRTAAWLLAKQGRFALGRSAVEPDWGIAWDGGDLPMPTLNELRRVVEPEVIAAFSDGDRPDWDRFVTAALAQRTPGLRHELYFRGWPGRRGCEGCLQPETSG